MNTRYACASLRHPTLTRPIAVHRSGQDRPGGLLSILPATELRRLVAAMVD